MVNFLVGTHAALGELGVLAFLWCMVELLNPTVPRVKRATIAAIIGTLFILASWTTGGYYYLNIYGSNIKPIINEGSQSWAHQIITETKEHVFLFLPFIAFLTTSLLMHHKNRLIAESALRHAIIHLCALVVIIGLLMAGMGYIISSAFRSSLGG